MHPLSIGGREDPARLVFTAAPGPGVVVGWADLGERFVDLVWSFRTPSPRPAPGEHRAVTPESTALAKALRAEGIRFVGPTTAYALMQATGLVDDHQQGCEVPEEAVLRAAVAAVAAQRAETPGRTR